jgi:CheY-like chemotaxis protein
MPFVETKPMPWAVNSLYSAKEGNKCTAAIVDTILVKGQDPKWLFTSKNGEVSKKRTCTGEAVRERFLKLLEATPPEDNPLRRCAVLRFPDSIKILSEEDFEKAIQNFPPRDSGLEALQVYMPSAGSAGTVYRNHYKVVSDKGRVQTATSSFASVPATLAHASSLTSDASQAVHAPSRAAKLNSTLDGATRTIVRYLESSHKVRVLDLEVDYMVDSDSQLWLLWCGDASVATGEAVLDLTLAGLTADRLVGRDSWLGEDVRKQSEAKERAESATAAASGKPKQSSPVKGAGGAGGKRSRLPGAVPDDVAAQQVAAAAEVAEALDGSERLELVRRGNRERLDDEDRRAFGGKAYDDELEGGGAGGASGSKGQSGKGKSADPHDRTFPNPFKSVGDFRRVGLRDPILLALDEGGELRSDSLPGSATGGGRRDGGARGGGGGRPRGGGGGDDDEEGPADPPPVDILLGPDSGAARMSYQSVARARAEARRLQEEEQLLQEQDAADGGSGEGKGAAPGVSGGAKGGRRGPLKGIHAPTAASESRRKWAAQRGEVPGGAANFYKEVSVTPKDMQVYTLLDRARRLREKQERLAADDEGRRARSDFLEPYGDHEIIEDMSAGGGGGGEHDDEWTRNSGDEYSSQGGHSQSGVGMSTERFSQTGGGSITGSYSSVVRSSKGSNKLQQQQQPEPAKWRGRLVEPSIEGTAAREEAVSGEVQKFDALDDYLRGKRDPREKGRRQQRAALARSQGAQEKLKDHARKEANKLGPILAGAPDPDADTLAAQDELYFASVLICDEDANGTDGLSAEGERARAILEKAGYYVDVESDGRKVIQLLLYQGKQYDCLLLERDCAVADGFEVTEAVRAKEKEERLARAREHADAVRSAKLGPKHVNIDPYVALPIIAFTGQVSPDDLRAYMEVGMDGCVSKPVEQVCVTQVYARVARMCSKRRWRKCDLKL